MKKILSVLAIAVLVLQSLGTSLVYAIGPVDGNEGGEPVATVDTVESSIPEEPKAEEPATVAEPVQQPAEDVEPVDEPKAPAEEPKVEEPTPTENAEQPAAETPTENAEEPAEDVEPVDEPKAPAEEPVTEVPMLNARELKALAVEELKTEEPAAETAEDDTNEPSGITWADFVENWNSAIDNQCSDFGCVTNPGKSTLEGNAGPNSALEPGQVGMWKLVEKLNDAGEYTITIGIKGEPKVVETETYEKSCAVVVFDKSNSMNSTSKWNNAVQGAIGFSEILKSKSDDFLIGLVTFGTRASVSRSLQNKVFVKSDFGSANGGGTNLHEGLMVANEMLGSSECNDANKYMIVMSDGEPTYFMYDDEVKGDGQNDYNACVEYDWVLHLIVPVYECVKEMKPSEAAINYASTLSDIEIFSVGYELNNNNNARGTLKSIADGDDHFFEGDASSIVEKFNKIAESIDKPAGTNAEVSDTIGSSVTLSDGTNEYEFDSITSAGYIHTFNIKVKNPEVQGNYDTNDGLTLDYTNVDSQRESKSIRESASINWTCGEGQHIELIDGAYKCVSNTKKEDCKPVKIANGESIVEKVDVTWNDETKHWNVTPECDFKCNKNYVKDVASKTCKDDKNNNGTADDEETFTVIYKDGETELKKVENLSGGDTLEAYTPTKKDYVFDAWDPEWKATVDAADANEDSEIIYSASWKDDKNNNGIDDTTELVAITFKAGDHGKLEKGTTGYTTEKTLLPGYDKYPAAPSTTADEGWKFTKWSPDYKVGETIPLSGAELEYTAQWEKVSNGGGGGGGGGSSTPDTYKCENLPDNAEPNNQDKPNKRTSYTYDEEGSSKVCTFHCKSGYTRDKENKKCVKSENPGGGNGGGDEEEIELGGQVSDKCSVEGFEGSEEEKAAYLYACENDITTIRDINKARLGDFLTRAEMAKMVSVFATKELGMKPNTSKDCSNFAESIAHYNQEMKDYMVMSCQLEVMGIHTTNYQAIPDFMPSKRVSRAEFGTILSRVLWGNKYEGTNENYYINHLNALKESNIITNINPNITEYRAWVFLMLYRSVEAIKIARANNNESIEQQVNEELQEEGKAETGLVVEYDSGSVVPDMATLTESGTLTTGAVAEIESGSVVETQTGATTALTGEDISKEVSAETGAVVETGSTSD